MKHYTLRMLIHDAKLFNQLCREYRRTRKNLRTSSSPDWRSRHLASLKLRAILRELIRTMLAIRMVRGELRQSRRLPAMSLPGDSGPPWARWPRGALFSPVKKLQKMLASYFPLF
jgi:hypothetical protein